MNISNKIYRLKTSRNYLKIIKLYHKTFKKFSEKKIDTPNFYNNKIFRYDIVQEIIKLKNYKNYLEIGCDQNELFSKVEIKNKIGVDPHNGGTHRMTSDEFFKNNHKKFDLVFIDGLHTYEQVKKDIINSLNSLNEKGIILLHDCFPQTYLDQAIPRGQRKWNGDVWKAIVEFRCKQKLSTYVGAFDNGIGLIFKRNNEEKLITEIIDFKNISYDQYYNNYEEFLNLVSYEQFLKIINEF